MNEEKKKQIAIFRFGVISGLIGLRKEEKGERERKIRALVASEWDIPYSERSSISRSTIQEWIQRYDRSGRRLESLYPVERKDKGRVRSMDTELQAALIALRKEFPKASIPTLVRIAQERRIVNKNESVSLSSMWRLLRCCGTEEDGADKADRRKFEAETVNDLWQADCMYGPYIMGDNKKRRTYLLAIIDDHSRLIVHAEFYLHDRTENFLDCLEKALRKRGMPRKLYVDNGPVFRSHRLKYITASLGIVLVHAKPYVPQGKGKIERWFKHVRLSFLSRLKGALSLEQLNDKLHQWITAYYHLKIHSSTREKPLARYEKHLHVVRIVPSDVREHFRTCIKRKVAADRTISLEGKLYEAPLGLIGKTVTVLFHQQERENIEVYYQKTSYGMLVAVDPAVNYRIGRYENKNAHPSCNDHTPRDREENKERNYQSGSLFEEKEDPDHE